MTRKYVFFFIFIFLSVFFYGCASLKKLQPLIDLGKNEKLKQEAYQEQSASFRRIKDYIDSDKIKEISSKEQALSTFGEPVITYFNGNQEKWVYKDSGSSWFEGGKIYLFFDNRGILSDWEAVYEH